MTIEEIRLKVSKHKRVSRGTIYNYFKVLEIEPVGARQSPQRYPDDAANRIISHLGFRIVSMNELRGERRRARRANGNGQAKRRAA
jgi:hypothetical protein